MYRAKCKICGKVFSATEKDDAIFEYRLHECKMGRNSLELPIRLLLKIQEGEMTEEEAWDFVDSGKKL